VGAREELLVSQRFVSFSYLFISVCLDIPWLAEGSPTHVPIHTLTTKVLWVISRCRQCLLFSLRRKTS
jgi:hypothetical protein